MKRFVLCVLLVAAGNAFGFQSTSGPTTHAHESKASISELHNFWNQYQEAVKQKDSNKLLTFYLNETIPVIGGIAPASYAVISAANKQPIPRVLVSTGKENAAGEIRLPPDVTENLQIQTDGEVGTLSWDYTATVGHGRITWAVVRTNDGWKIASIVFSLNVPAADKKS